MDLRLEPAAERDRAWLDQLRRAAYREVARIFREDRFILPIVPRVRLFVSQADVKDIGWSADGFAIFEKVQMTK